MNQLDISAYDDAVFEEAFLLYDKPKLPQSIPSASDNPSTPQFPSKMNCSHSELTNASMRHAQPNLRSRFGTEEKQLVSKPSSPSIPPLQCLTTPTKSPFSFSGSSPFKFSSKPRNSPKQSKTPFISHSSPSFNRPADSKKSKSSYTTSSSSEFPDEDISVLPAQGSLERIGKASNRKQTKSNTNKSTKPPVIFPIEDELVISLDSQDEHPADQKNTDFSSTTNFGMDYNGGNENNSYPEYDAEALKTWKYPSNYEMREYQFEMTKTSLFQNTLVCLPTGLGKTLIAAVVIFNFYRWFPKGKIVFMAPTKHLVSQQLEACRSVVNSSIPSKDVAAMTGTLMDPQSRIQVWQQKRVFFVTPEVPQNDIKNSVFPSKDVVLLVVDEAHRARGDYSFCQVIRHVSKFNPNFRVLALSATPGSDSNAIQEVISNLLISKMEVRTEHSPDVQPFTHHRLIEEIHVKLEGTPIMKVKDKLKDLINVPLNWLQLNGVLYRTKQGDFFTFTRLEAARNHFHKDQNFQRKDAFWKGNVESRFATAMSMYYGQRLVTDYGLAPFKEWFNNQTKRPLMEKTSKYFQEFVSSKEWQNLSHFINHEIGDPQRCKHPKLLKLESVVLKHFESIRRAEGGSKSSSSASKLNSTSRSAAIPNHPSNDEDLFVSLGSLPPESISNEDLERIDGNSRIMIFVQFRDTVEEIVNLLKNHEPFIRPMAFVGQSKKGLSQKKQAEVVKNFREGRFNTLVSTSVGEEGLDIGEVDLIVCYDSQSSPIRRIQRMGRTGRKRNGKCVMLLTQGSEDVAYKRSKSKGDKMMKVIQGQSNLHFFEGRRLWPAEIQPSHQLEFMQPTVHDKDENDEPFRFTKNNKNTRKKTTPTTSKSPNGRKEKNDGTEKEMQLENTVNSKKKDYRDFEIHFIDSEEELEAEEDQDGSELDLKIVHSCDNSDDDDLMLTDMESKSTMITSYANIMDTNEDASETEEALGVSLQPVKTQNEETPIISNIDNSNVPVKSLDPPIEEAKVEDKNLNENPQLSNLNLHYTLSMELSSTETDSNFSKKPSFIAQTAHTDVSKAHPEAGNTKFAEFDHLFDGNLELECYMQEIDAKVKAKASLPSHNQTNEDRNAGNTERVYPSSVLVSSPVTKPSTSAVEKEAMMMELLDFADFFKDTSSFQENFARKVSYASSSSQHPPKAICKSENAVEASCIPIQPMCSSQPKEDEEVVDVEEKQPPNISTEPNAILEKRSKLRVVEEDEGSPSTRSKPRQQHQTSKQSSKLDFSPNISIESLDSSLSHKPTWKRLKRGRPSIRDEAEELETSEQSAVRSNNPSPSSNLGQDVITLDSSIEALPSNQKKSSLSNTTGTSRMQQNLKNQSLLVLSSIRKSKKFNQTEHPYSSTTNWLIQEDETGESVGEHDEDEDDGGDVPNSQDLDFIVPDEDESDLSSYSNNIGKSLSALASVDDSQMDLDSSLVASAISLALRNHKIHQMTAQDRQKQLSEFLKHYGEIESEVEGDDCQQEEVEDEDGSSMIPDSQDLDFIVPDDDGDAQ